MRKVFNLGDAGVPDGGSDELYTGDVGESQLSMQYYRDKVTEFQVTLNALDRAYNGALMVMNASSDASLNADLQAFLADFNNRKWQLKTTAQALNAGAEMINMAGGRMPELSIPNGLGLGPLIIPAATVAAIGVAASLVIWGNTWVKGLNDRLKRSQVIEAAQQIATQTGNTAVLNQVVAGISETDNAVATIDSSGFSSIAGTLKYAAIGLALFMAYRIYTQRS